MIDDMDFDRIASAWATGKRVAGISIESDTQIAEISRNWRRYVYGL